MCPPWACCTRWAAGASSPPNTHHGHRSLHSAPQHSLQAGVRVFPLASRSAQLAKDSPGGAGVVNRDVLPDDWALGTNCMHTRNTVAEQRVVAELRNTVSRWGHRRVHTAKLGPAKQQALGVRLFPSTQTPRSACAT